MHACRYYKIELLRRYFLRKTSNVKYGASFWPTPIFVKHLSLEASSSASNFVCCFYIDNVECLNKRTLYCGSDRFFSEEARKKEYLEKVIWKMTLFLFFLFSSFCSVCWSFLWVGKLNRALNGLININNKIFKVLRNRNG